MIVPLLGQLIQYEGGGLPLRQRIICRRVALAQEPTNETVGDTNGPQYQIRRNPFDIGEQLPQAQPCARRRQSVGVTGIRTWNYVRDVRPHAGFTLRSGVEPQPLHSCRATAPGNLGRAAPEA